MLGGGENCGCSQWVKKKRKSEQRKLSGKTRSSGNHHDVAAAADDHHCWLHLAIVATEKWGGEGR